LSLVLRADKGARESELDVTRCPGG
jgi:hypothetical protein